MQNNQKEIRKRGEKKLNGKQKKFLKSLVMSIFFCNFVAW